MVTCQLKRQLATQVPPAAFIPDAALDKRIDIINNDH
jgi:hypothetical protein